jgi:hypothetical protein
MDEPSLGGIRGISPRDVPHPVKPYRRCFL